MERDHYDERHARDLSREFIDTLSFLHANGVVHLDLKPEKCGGRSAAATPAPPRRAKPLPRQLLCAFFCC